MGIGPIPWVAIDQWANRHGPSDPDDYDDFLTLIRAMDDVYLDHVNSKTGNTK